MRSSVATADISAGVFAALGIVTALYDRKSSGEGRRVELNLLESMMSLMATNFQMYFASGKVPQPLSSRHAAGLFMGAFQTKNGYIMLGPCWPRITREVKREWILEDPRFETPEKRFANKKELEDIVEDALREADSEYWLELLQMADIPAAPVYTLDEVITDPQVIHNKTLIEMNHPLCGLIKGIDCPIHLIDGIQGEADPAPTLGQHTAEVLKDLLGYSEDQIRELQQEADGHATELEEHVQRKA